MAIEWAERLPYKPDNYLQICLKLLQDSGRQIELIGDGDLLDWSITGLTKGDRT